MANRPDNFSPTVTDVVPENPDTGTLTHTIMAVGAQIADASAQTKALKAVADTQVGFSALDRKFRQEYADDPTNPEGIKNLQAQRKALTTDIGKNVPTYVMRDYTQKALELSSQSTASNEVWTTHQQVRNTVNNLATTQKTYLLQANQAGQSFGESGGDITDAMNYMQANQSIRQFAEPVLGKDKVDKALGQFNTNYVKSFVAGVAEKHPDQAAALLEDPNLQAHFSTQDRGDMIDLINRTKKQQDMAQQLQTVKQQSQLPDIVNNPEVSYFEKRAEIDRLDMQGSITPKAAAAARRVIKSSEDLDSQTDTPAMADTINKIYDLNENTGLKQSEYLNGVKSLQENVLAMQDSGQLTGQDAVKLNKEISTLTQKRMSEATKAVGYKFGSANKKFDTLPPEYRGQATRQLFYASQGQDLTPQQLSSQADGIIDVINKKRRADALSIVSRTTNDDVFLQVTGYTRADVATTAQKRGLSQDQVIQALRDKYAKKRGKTVTKVAPADDTSNASGISINAPAPPEEPVDGEE